MPRGSWSTGSWSSASTSGRLERGARRRGRVPPSHGLASGGTMKRLTGLDASFLYMETPTAPMHVAGLYVYDPSDIPGGYSFEKVEQVVKERLHLLPPYRQRVVEIPFQLYHPLWIEDPDFDLHYHLRRAALPAPGGKAELAELAADIMSRPLDRSRPLWEMWLVEGLEDGLVACLSKPDRVPTDFELVSYATRSLARSPISAAKATRRTLDTALTLRRRNRQPDVK